MENEAILGLPFIAEQETVGTVGRGTAASVCGLFLASCDTVCGVGRPNVLAMFLAERTTSPASGRTSRGGDEEVIVIIS